MIIQLIINTHIVIGTVYINMVFHIWVWKLYAMISPPNWMVMMVGYFHGCPNFEPWLHYDNDVQLDPLYTSKTPIAQSESKFIAEFSAHLTPLQLRMLSFGRWVTCRQIWP
jgi:hypothetical protein